MTHHSDTDAFDDLRHIAGLALSRAGKKGPVREGLQRRIDRLEAWLKEADKQHGELLTELEIAVLASRPVAARRKKDWHEDFGEALWWRFPIVEPPYVGSPLDTEFPKHLTHWTPLGEPPAMPE